MKTFIERNLEMTNTKPFTTEREIKLTLADLDENIDRWGARFALKFQRLIDSFFCEYLNANVEASRALSKRMRYAKYNRGAFMITKYTFRTEEMHFFAWQVCNRCATGWRSARVGRRLRVLVTPA